MAELNKTVLGRLSGAVGDVVFRQRNGKNYVGTKPAPFMPGDDPASVARRERFAITGKLAKAINSIAIIKSLWKESTPSGLSPYLYMVQLNYPHIVDGAVSNSAYAVSPLIGGQIFDDTGSAALSLLIGAGVSVFGGVTAAVMLPDQTNKETCVVDTDSELETIQPMDDDMSM